MDHFSHEEATWAKVALADLTTEERRLIKAGKLGYCENHRILYKKWALRSCIIPGITCKCDDPNHHLKAAEFGPCKEW